LGKNGKLSKTVNGDSWGLGIFRRQKSLQTNKCSKTHDVKPNRRNKEKKFDNFAKISDNL
jgi:hypothetical protein